MTQKYPVLKITTDFGSGDVTGTFEFGGSPEVSEETNVEPIIGGSGQLVTALFSEYLDQADVTTREGVFVDLGAGSHVFEFGSELSTGSDTYQWGDDGTADAVTETDATGGSALEKAQVLEHYLRQGKHVADSVNPATLEYGIHSTTGILEPLDVYIPRIGLDDNPQDPSSVQIAVTCVETADISLVQDAAEMLGL